MSDIKQTAPYGAWPSPITSDLIVSESIRMGQVVVSGEAVYWTEGRPDEGGRSALVRWTVDDGCGDVLPPEFNVRTRVHEYGGGDFFVHEDSVFFSNDQDRRLYRFDPGHEPRPLSERGPWRFADGTYDSVRGRVICVVEEEAPGEPLNYIGALSGRGTSVPRRLIEGEDFYSNPALRPDGSQLVWLSWRHPRMPWDGTELWIGQFAQDGSVTDRRLLAGGPEESVFQPSWSPDGRLYFVSDRSGWWNLYRWDGAEAEAVAPIEAELGMPQWVFGMTTYAFLPEGRIACAVHRGEAWDLCVIEPDQGRLRSLEAGYTDIQSVHATPRAIVFKGGSPSRTESLIRRSVETGEQIELRRSSSFEIDAGLRSEPVSVTFPAADGGEAYALFYSPINPGFSGPAGERPPLLVKSHGGPTSCADHVLSPRYQYWTSRGFAVLDVNYRGSTGFGRAYRLRLDGQWGVADVEDCIDAARHVAAQGWVDGDRMVISGGSAGGFTTLAALTFHDVFRAGASYYGVSDLETLATDTHKFESRYLDRLIGAYPEQRRVYLDRSPLHHSDRLQCPVIFFQGLEDRIVPPSQAESMVDALKKKGVPVAYLPFEGEQHGFRRAENIKRALDAEWYFYARVFGLPIPPDVEQIPIHATDSGKSTPHR